MKQKLTRSRTDSKLAGVCGGLAKFLNIDVVIIRALWVISAFLGGPSIGVYILCAIIIPKENLDTNGRYTNNDSDDDGPVYGYEEQSTHDEEADTSDESSDYDDHYYERDSHDDEDDEDVKYELNKGYMGLGLIALGGYLAFKAMFPNFSFKFFWPVLLIGIGLLILGRNNDNKEMD